MQLYNTLTRELTELPEPPGPIGMYVCGPTVYARAHIGNARPFVLASWYKRWLRERGYDVTLVHNITDVNDKIYEAAPGASAERARQATEWYLEDTGRFGLDEVDHWPKVTETMDEIVAFIADLIERGFAYEVDGDVYFRVSRWAEYGRLSGQKPDQVEEQEPNPRKEDPRDFALWKANKPDEDTCVGLALGAGAAGLAHRVLGDGGEAARPGLRDPRRRARPRLPAPRERAGAIARPRARVREGLDAQRHAPLHRREDVEVGRQRRDDRRGARPLGARRRRSSSSSPLTGGARSTSPTSAWPTRRHAPRGCARCSGIRPSRPPPDAWERFQAALDDDFSTPAALALMHEWRDHELLRRALDVFGLSGLAEQEEAPAEVHALAAGRQEARAAKDFARADELREQIEAAGWDVRDDSGGYRLVPRQ